MGTSYSVYIGPYIEVMCDITKSVEKVKRVCPNHINLNQGNNKYCSECGSLIIDEDYVDMVEISVGDFLYGHHPQFEDDLHIINIMGESRIIIPNDEVPYSYDIPDSYYGGGSLELKDVDYVSTNQKLWILKEFKVYIETLIGELGENNVQVKWGYVGYWS
jgi:hypothetical protein